MTIFAVGHPPHPTGHNLSGATKKPSFARFIVRYVFLDEVGKLSLYFTLLFVCHKLYKAKEKNYLSSHGKEVQEKPLGL